MIVNSNKRGVNVVPCLGKNNVVVKKIMLLPGMNDVPEEDWEKAKGALKADIARGLIEEVAADKIEEVEKEVKDEKGQVKKEKSKEKIPALKTMSAEEAEKIVSDTYNLKTLNKWREEENRDSVRTVILNQIETVEKYGEDKKKKKKKADEGK